MSTASGLYVAPTLADALAALGDGGADAAPLAGGTWIMRAPLRHEAPRGAYVALSGLGELTRIEIASDGVSIGACVTHSALAMALAGLPDLAALAQAAGHSANPAVRNVATIGGNLCSANFAAADLVPALICLKAEVELIDGTGRDRIAIERFLELRSALPPGRIVARVLVPRSAGRSAHVRLPLRKAGDYPVAIVSCHVELDGRGHVGAIRVAVGSVEATARRWPGLEGHLAGRPLDAQRAFDSTKFCVADFTGRDGVEAPGWYRTSVLPALVRRAVLALGPRSIG
jgi:carbon-monoxide dehydrogenase medium subunit